jgi:hypothetical protein
MRKLKTTIDAYEIDGEVSLRDDGSLLVRLTHGDFVKDGVMTVGAQTVEQLTSDINDFVALIGNQLVERIKARAAIDKYLNEKGE